MDSEQFSVERVQVALGTAVSDDCLKLARAAYENARMDGLCHDGAWECALNALRSLNATALLSQIEKDGHYG